MNYDLYAQMRSAPVHEWLSGLRRDSNSFEWCVALPVLPDEQFQRRFCGKAYAAAMQQAFEAVERFKEGLENTGCQLSEDAVVLDFGCGWGRISQALYRYFKPGNIISADVQSEAVDFCRRSGLATRIMEVCGNGLPQIADQTLDYVFAYSVFSHLSERSAHTWMTEFARILKPGGAIAVTTRTPLILRHVANLRKLPNQAIPAHARGLLQAFSDGLERPLRDYKAGRFVYRSYPAPAKPGPEYGEALVPEKYVKRVWQPLFGGPYSFLPPVRTVDQAVIVIRKAQG